MIPTKKNPINHTKDLGIPVSVTGPFILMQSSAVSQNHHEQQETSQSELHFSILWPTLTLLLLLLLFSAIFCIGCHPPPLGGAMLAGRSILEGAIRDEPPLPWCMAPSRRGAPPRPPGYPPPGGALRCWAWGGIQPGRAMGRREGIRGRELDFFFEVARWNNGRLGRGYTWQ